MTNLEPYFLIKLLHILLFVYWLGGDIGVFYSAIHVRKHELTIPARQTALTILAWVDQIPRFCLVFMLPVGYSLAAQLGVVRASTMVLFATWLVAFAWAAMVASIHHYQGTPRGQRLRNIDLVWRCLLVGGLLWDAWQGFMGSGHVLARWVAAKLIVFALLITCGIMIRLRGTKLGPALRQLFENGSTPQIEAAIKLSFARTRPFVLLIWALLVVAAYIGIAKPAFGV